MKKYSFIKVFLALVLLTTNACAMKNLKSTYDEKTQTTKYEKTLKPPISIPFDITKQGNKIELELKIKESNSYSFELEFHYDDPRRSKYFIIEMVKSFFPSKKYSDEEWNEIVKDERRVRGLMGYSDSKIVIEKGVKKIIDIDYPGIPTPIHLTIIKLEDDGSSKVVFDGVVEKLEQARPGYYFWKRIKWVVLKPGIYKIIAKAEKNSPEFIGTKTHLWINGWFAK